MDDNLIKVKCFLAFVSSESMTFDLAQVLYHIQHLEKGFEAVQAWLCFTKLGRIPKV